MPLKIGKKIFTIKDFRTFAQKQALIDLITTTVPPPTVASYDATIDIDPARFMACFQGEVGLYVSSSQPLNLLVSTKGLSFCTFARIGNAHNVLIAHVDATGEPIGLATHIAQFSSKENIEVTLIGATNSAHYQAASRKSLETVLTELLSNPVLITLTHQKILDNNLFNNSILGRAHFLKDRILHHARILYETVFDKKFNPLPFLALELSLFQHTSIIYAGNNQMTMMADNFFSLQELFEDENEKQQIKALWSLVFETQDPEAAFNDYIRSLFCKEIFDQLADDCQIFSELRNFMIDSTGMVYPISAHIEKPYEAVANICQIEQIIHPAPSYDVCYKNGFYLAPILGDKMRSAINDLTPMVKHAVNTQELQSGLKSALGAMSHIGRTIFIRAIKDLALQKSVLLQHYPRYIQKKEVLACINTPPENAITLNSSMDQGASSTMIDVYCRLQKNNTLRA